MLWVKDGKLFDGVLVLGDRRIWIDGEPDPYMMIQAGYIEYDPYSGGGGQSVAVSPVGFQFSDMTQTADGYTITLQGFVVAVENDVTGTVVCDIEYSQDGDSTLLFTDTETEWFSESNNFTAYMLTNLDGSKVPIRNKTNV